MDTIIVSIISAAATTAIVYWYLHKKNPDLAQKVTDTLVEDVKAPVEAVTTAGEQAKAAIDDLVATVKKD